MPSEEWKQQQIEYIRKLPKRTVNIGEKRQVIACDFAKRMAYFLDEKGFPSGQATRLDDTKMAQLNREKERQATERMVVETEAEEQTRPSLRGFLGKIAERTGREQEDDECDGSESENQEDTLARRQNRKKKLAAGVLVVLAVAAAALSAKYMAAGKPAEPGSTGAVALDKIDVIQVTKELIPGDVITSDTIQKVSISAEAYNQISLSSVNLYQWSRSDSLLDAYAVRYIPRGQYLTYDNVNTVYQQKSNPWGKAGEGNTFLTLPIEDGGEGMNYGKILNLTITKKTVKETNSKRGEGEEPPGIDGLEHKTSVEQSAVVDTYGLSNVVLCDMLNGDNGSLYETFTSWMEIPAGEQSSYIKNRLLADKTLKEKLTPKYIKVRVTKEQAAALGSLTEGDVTVAIKLQDKSEIGTDAKRLYAAEAEALMKTISNLTKEVQQETSEDGKKETS